MYWFVSLVRTDGGKRLVKLPSASSAGFVLRFLERVCRRLQCDNLFSSQPFSPHNTYDRAKSGIFDNIFFIWPSKGAFTPDVNDANKSRYSREVGRLNILSLLASFAREIRFIRAWNSLHNRREFTSWEGLLQAAPVLLQNVFLFL